MHQMTSTEVSGNLTATGEPMAAETASMPPAAAVSERGWRQRQTQRDYGRG